jgi:hypothetical protein
MDYLGNKSTPTANLTITKLLINLTISMPGEIFLGIDLANFYLNTPLPNYEYVPMSGHHPRKIILPYNLHNIFNPEGWVYIETSKGM